ncbi:MAG TPA: flagellar export chaperone FliS, partial [Verrucomicrobiae bacterium]|nr:flagellar export chaperone FliS [Verrucomicrobiae bacterium]
MNSAHSWKSYRQIAAQTAPPGQLVLMLFDGALHSLERALTGFDYDDPREKNQTIHNNLQRAVDIIRTLNSCLNLEAGGKLAETLRNLYDYFDRRIV